MASELGRWYGEGTKGIKIVKVLENFAYLALMSGLCYSRYVGWFAISVEILREREKRKRIFFNCAVLFALLTVIHARINAWCGMIRPKLIGSNYLVCLCGIMVYICTDMSSRVWEALLEMFSIAFLIFLPICKMNQI